MHLRLVNSFCSEFFRNQCNSLLLGIICEYLPCPSQNHFIVPTHIVTIPPLAGIQENVGICDNVPTCDDVFFRLHRFYGKN